MDIGRQVAKIQRSRKFKKNYAPLLTFATKSLGDAHKLALDGIEALGQDQALGSGSHGVGGRAILGGDRSKRWSRINDRRAMSALARTGGSKDANGVVPLAS